LLLTHWFLIVYWEVCYLVISVYLDCEILKKFFYLGIRFAAWSISIAFVKVYIYLWVLRIISIIVQKQLIAILMVATYEKNSIPRCEIVYINLILAKIILGAFLNLHSLYLWILPLWEIKYLLLKINISKRLNAFNWVIFIYLATLNPRKKQNICFI